MNEILKKMKAALLAEGKKGVNLDTVFDEARSARINERIQIMLQMARGAEMYPTYTDQLKRYERYELSDDEAEWVLAFSRIYAHLERQWANRFAEKANELLADVVPRILEEVTGGEATARVGRGLGDLLKTLIEDEDGEPDDELMNLFDKAKAAADAAAVEPDEEEEE